MDSLNVFLDKFLKKEKTKVQEIVIKLYTVLWARTKAVKLKTCFQVGLLGLVCLYSKTMKNYLTASINLIGEIWPQNFFLERSNQIYLIGSGVETNNDIKVYN